MSTPEATPNFTQITIGYSDSEDRLWVRLSGRRAGALFWLSRRMLRLFLRSTFDLLARGQSPADFSAKHLEIVAQLKPAGAPKGSDDPVRNRATEQFGLLNSVDVSVNGARLSLNLRGAGGSAGFACDRPRAHQLLQAFWNRQRHAGWDIEAPWAVDEQAAPANQT